LKKSPLVSKVIFVLFPIAIAGPCYAYDPGIAGKSYVDNIDAAVTVITTALDNAKADKKIPSVTGNIATLDGTGNLADGGVTVGSLATKTELSGKVSTTGAESVAGVKTFSEIPMIPTATLPVMQ
jgi:hypothetical protein